ncbi:hypothetical protein IHQ68_08150 [Chelatococcus sambhunathii]|uniref:Uncharacterized protein n=1 Tax=Chelatococcus sambhunathii TaxID=363953 RepID=A0ABU1DES4_9HYPH|nr:hypothetical protein [Chelatococcus sambhunathii]MDR4306587.1 hypothetical protein [Chelatococcus sambhunathii]
MRRAFKWISLLLLLSLPGIVGYAQSRDARGAMTEISNRAAKGDRLPSGRPSEPVWLSCAPARRAGDADICRVFAPAD